jgi:pimeloyl-ACP methyl ester carboxylesterase
MAGATGDGGRHVLGRVTGELSKMPVEILPCIAACWSRADFYRGMRFHIESVPETVREMCIANPIDRTPVLVLTPEQSTPLNSLEIAAIGTHVLQRIVPHSGHWVHLDQPGFVIQAILEFVTTHKSQVVS